MAGVRKMFVVPTSPATSLASACLHGIAALIAVPFAKAAVHSLHFAGPVGGACKGGLATPVSLPGSPMLYRPRPICDLRGNTCSWIGYTISMMPPSKDANRLLTPSNLSRVIVRCHVAEACLGGPEALCADGYTARRCGRCADGWYSYVDFCKPCGTSVAVHILNVTAALIAFLLGLFMLWQLLLDPRVASPFVFFMRLMETLAIMNRTGLAWPPAARDAFALGSLVNFNTEIFRFECSLGHPEPLSRVVTAACFPIGAGLVFILAWPLIQLLAKVRAGKHPLRAESAHLESMCAKLHPDAPAAHKNGLLGFRPTDALAAASWVEYIRILAAVTLLARLRFGFCMLPTPLLVDVHMLRIRPRAFFGAFDSGRPSSNL